MQGVSQLAGGPQALAEAHTMAAARSQRGGARLKCHRHLPPVLNLNQPVCLPVLHQPALLPLTLSQHQITTVQHGDASFTVIRDDLLHPFLGGNKLRKLDGLWAQLAGATDVVSCGGLQSAHTVAVAAACAQHGKRCHLLVRGERPAVPTGHHLYARLFAHRIQYVSRAEYADRDGMLAAYVQQLQLQRSQAQQQGGQSGLGSTNESRTAANSSHEAATAAAAAAVSGGISLDTRSPSSGSSSGQRVVVVPEGAAEPGALLGLIRLVGWLAAHPVLAGRRCNIVVDSGTGVTATGALPAVHVLRPDSLYCAHVSAPCLCKAH